MQEPFLEIRGLRKVYHADTPSEVVALRDVSLLCTPGEFVTIVGSNAAGKTTLFNSIAGSLVPDAGDILLGGKSLVRIPEYQRSRSIARVRQNPNDGAIGGMTIAENFAMAALRSQVPGIGRGVAPSEKERCAQLLAPLGLGLERRVDDPLDLLSGGQKQAVVLLMATLIRPELLLLDEHTAALDPRMSECILSITDRLVRERGITTLMITHNITHAIAYGDRMLLMDRGRIAFEARGEEKRQLSVGAIIRKIEDHAAEFEEDFHA